MPLPKFLLLDEEETITETFDTFEAATEAGRGQAEGDDEDGDPGGTVAIYKLVGTWKPEPRKVTYTPAE